MTANQRTQQERLFQSVRDFYATPESLAYYCDRARNQGLFPPERAMIERFMGAPATALDIGCGAGREAFVLTRMGYAVTGIDVSRELLEQGRALAAELRLDVEFRPTGGRSLDFADGSFDYVLLITQMIHHLPLRANRLHLLREAGRVVKPEGSILLTYHDHEIVRTHKPWGGDRPPGHRAQQVASTYSILEPGDRFDNDCQGERTDVFGNGHRFTMQEMEGEVLGAGLRIVERADFYTIAGGDPDEFWKPTQILLLKR